MPKKYPVRPPTTLPGTGVNNLSSLTQANIPSPGFNLYH